MSLRLPDNALVFCPIRVPGPGSRVPKSFFRGTKLASLLCLLFVSIIAFTSCGGSYGGVMPGYDGSVPEDPTEQIILSENYAGYLVLHLEEGLGARLNASKSLYSTKGQLDPLIAIEGVINSYPTVSLRQSVGVDADRLDALKERLERLSGKRLADFNSIYKIDAPDPDEAVSVYRRLRGRDGVRLLYPAQKTSQTGIIDVPDLTSHQGYLYPESTHAGLNAEAAWTAGITGQNVQVTDMESGWNYDHEDLPLSPDVQACPLTSTDEGCLKAIAHGTCVAGIVGALHNGHGTDGFAPDADLRLDSISHVDNIDTSLLDMLDGDETNGEIYPGSILFIEVQMQGLLATAPSCGDDPYGCVPTSILPLNYDAMEYAIAAGVIVIEGGGNGSVDLGDPGNYGAIYTNISLNDSGSIIVGASMGASEEIAPFSNWGSRMDVFAWGSGVATTSFPSSYPLDWYGSTPPVPLNDETNTHYTDNFGGTSAAAAMIAGSAALVQSYAKQEFVNETTRHIMPLKMREILVNSGVVQSGPGGNIGMQPRIDVAMGLVDTFVASVFSSYPELVADDQLTDSEYLALRAMGVGLICKSYDSAGSDPSCPDSELFPEGTKISTPYDFDGDGRADLVQFRSDGWRVDLSGTGTAADGFGAWDIDVSFTPLPGEVVWAYVADMNSDGRSDFVAYDKLNGTFYVHLTNTDLTRDNIWHGWDWIIDYSAEWHDEYTIDPDDADYSRPFIAQYNNDAYLDIGIACSDGFVRVDYGDGTETGLGSFEWSSQLITDTMLAQAPGWAYLPSPGDFNGNGTQFFSIKVPDTHPDEGRMYIIPHDGVNYLPDWDWMEMMGAPYIFGGSDHVPTVAQYDGGVTIGVKNGDWLITDAITLSSLYSLSPTDIYGASDCHPVVGRFDNDLLDDRVVMCPSEWRIAYTSDEYDSLLSTDGARHVSLGYDPCEFPLPGRSYAGGISYAHATQLMDLYQAMNPGDPVPIMVDMITISSQ